MLHRVLSYHLKRGTWTIFPVPGTDTGVVKVSYNVPRHDERHSILLAPPGYEVRLSTQLTFNTRNDPAMGDPTVTDKSCTGITWDSWAGDSLRRSSIAPIRQFFKLATRDRFPNLATFDVTCGNSKNMDVLLHLITVSNGLLHSLDISGPFPNTADAMMPTAFGELLDHVVRHEPALRRLTVTIFWHQIYDDLVPHGQLVTTVGTLQLEELHVKLSGKQGKEPVNLAFSLSQHIALGGVLRLSWLDSKRAPTHPQETSKRRRGTQDEWTHHLECSWFVRSLKR
jgi:hypothetical protein